MSKIFFIVGNPRSGKTLLQSLLKFNPEIGWFSQYNARFPHVSFLTLLNRIYDLPLSRTLLKKNYRFLPRPAELSKRIVLTLERDGSLDESDVTPNDAFILKKVFYMQSKLLKKNTLMVDEGRPARIRYFNAIFPKSYFIHVVRDGRDVVSELLETRRFWFPRDKSIDNIYPRGIPKLKREFSLWQDNPHKQLVLASFRWKAAVHEIERQKRILPKNRFLTIHYEDLINSPIKTFESVMNFLKLKNADKFSKTISSSNFQQLNYRKSSFTKNESLLLNRLLKTELSKYNYLHDKS